MYFIYVLYICINIYNINQILNTSQERKRVCIKGFLLTDYLFTNIKACVFSILEIVSSYLHAFYDANRVIYVM